MKSFYYLSFLALVVLLYSCNQVDSKSDKSILSNSDSLPNTWYDEKIEQDVILKSKRDSIESVWDALPDSAFVELIQKDTSFRLDIRYATTDNFMHEKVYPCPKFLLRKVAAEALIKAQKVFLEKGYSLLLFDGYRPLSVQWILWNKTPNKNYVANPKKGSNHNKGCAVDLSLWDLKTAKEVDMGTPYDFFGPEAHHTYTALPEEVLEMRSWLKREMIKVGFRPISNEWWHYDFHIKYAVSDHPLPCNN